MTEDAACGDTKGCFSDCDGGSCQFVVSWTSTADKGQYTLQAPVSGTTPYIAVGFSSDATMVLIVFFILLLISLLERPSFSTIVLFSQSL